MCKITINENQKAVSKNLRNTLNADLLWNSENYLEQMTALRSRIAILLGEDRASAIYEKISIGEDKKVITTQQIDNAIKKSVFLGKVLKDKIEKHSLFNLRSLDLAFEKLSKFMLLSFDFLKDRLEDEWEKADGIIVINKGIYSIIMILSDIIDHLTKMNEISERDNVNIIFEKVEKYLAPLVTFYKNVDEDTITSLKTAYGTGGDVKYWRTLQKFIREQCPDFNPEGLDDYLRNFVYEGNEYCDTLEIKQDGTIKIIKRIGVDDEGNLYLLEKENEIILKDKIVLPSQKESGTYYFIKEIQGIKYYAKYITKNDYSDAFLTELE